MANTTQEVDEISQIVKRVVEWSKDHPGSSLDDLEKQVQKAVVELRKKLMEVTVEAQGEGRINPNALSMRRALGLSRVPKTEDSHRPRVY